VNAVRTMVRWQGSLAEATADSTIFDSPARREIARRILGGDSAVWLLVAPEQQLQHLSEQLQATLDGVSKDLMLPQGIGLPGSELYAAIPLEIRFSVLPVSHADAHEQPFLQLLAASAKDWRADAAYVIPVFGRCRALEVFAFEEADELLARDVGEFLCGACSCQVKQANPGFDLLTSVDWHQRLFGESVPEVISNQPTSRGELAPSEPSSAPEFVTIPAGSSSTAMAQSVASQNSSTTSDEQVGMTGFVPWPQIRVLLAVFSLVVVTVVTSFIVRRR
jgi:hypothetical protein